MGDWWKRTDGRRNWKGKTDVGFARGWQEVVDSTERVNKG